MGDFSKRIGILMGREAGYAARIELGIHRYAAAGRRWVFRHAPGISGLKSLLEWGAAGIVGMVGDAALRDAVAASGVPAVNVSNRLMDALPARVHVDDLEVGRQVARHLLSRGLRSFAFAGQVGCYYADQRGQGFIEVLADRGHECRILDRQAERAAGMRGLDAMFARWLKGLELPVGVMASDDDTGERILDVCLEYGLEVPEQVALVAVNDGELVCEGTVPPMSSVAVPFERIGFEAGRLLQGLLEGRAAPAEPILLPPGDVVARRSSDVVAPGDPLVARAVRLMNEHVGEGLNVEGVLERLGVSRRLLEHRFSAALGALPAGVLQDIRLGRVRELLATTDLPMANVAAACGYTSQTRMGIAFRRVLGQTPGAYRRQFRLS